MESEKGKQPSKAAALAEINKYHLMFAGYSPADILGLGDLGKLTQDRMGELIRRKVMDEAAKSFNKDGVQTKTFPRAGREEAVVSRVARGDGRPEDRTRRFFADYKHKVD